VWELVSSDVDVAAIVAVAVVADGIVVLACIVVSCTCVGWPHDCWHWPGPSSLWHHAGRDDATC